MRITYNQEFSHRLKAVCIGCGSHAQRNIFPTFQYAPVDLAAVCDLDRERAEAAARLFGARAVYTDYRQMLAQERPDVAFVVLNYDEHGCPPYPAVAMDVLRAGTHVWIEKPPASSADEIRQMRAVSADTGKFVGVGFKKMFFPALVKVKEIITRPEFGPISTITARYPQSLPPQTERPDTRKMTGFLDHIVHPYSVLLFLAGPVESLFVQRCEATGGSVTALRFRSGAVGSLHLAARQSGMSPLERVEVIGAGTNVVADNNLRVTYYRPGAPAAGYGREGSFYGADEAAPLFWEPEFSLGQLYNKGLFLLGYAPEIQYFCACVQEERPPETGSLEDALEILKVYEAYRQPDSQLITVPPE
jgi:predicted dehydrogenase